LLIVLSTLYIKYIYNNVHARTHYICRARQKFWNGLKYYVILCNCISIKKWPYATPWIMLKLAVLKLCRLITLKTLIEKKFITSVLETSITKICKKWKFPFKIFMLMLTTLLNRCSIGLFGDTSRHKYHSVFVIYWVPRKIEQCLCH